MDWWRKDEQALPGLATGSISGLAILNVDATNGKQGFRNLRALGGLPKTFTVSASASRVFQV